MNIHNLSQHDSLLGQYIKEVRSLDIQKDRLRFRTNIERIGMIMAYELSKELNFRTEIVETPLGNAEVATITDRVVLATILRAGLPFHNGFLRMFDNADNAFLSAYRRVGRNVHGEAKLEIVSEYLAAPDIEGSTLLIIDPMFATGMSMDVAYEALLSHGRPKTLHLCCVIGTEKALEYIEGKVPQDTSIWCAAIDKELNEKNYIVPGLGDAGDLCYGEKL